MNENRDERIEKQKFKYAHEMKWIKDKCTLFN